MREVESVKICRKNIRREKRTITVETGHMLEQMIVQVAACIQQNNYGKQNNRVKYNSDIKNFTGVGI